MSDEALLQSVPLIDPKMDLRSLPLDAREGFVLSRIDGSCNVQMLAAVTGMGEDEIVGVVSKLARLGAVVFKGAKVPQVVLSTTAPPLATPTPPPPPAITVAPNGEHIDLAPADQQRINDLHEILGKASHYDVLQLMRDAQPADIKSAYYKFSKDFHPDRYFGKRLGPYKAMLEKIFKAGKVAYETLSDPQVRSTYDKLLPKGVAPVAGAFTDPEQQKRAELEAHRQKILEDRKKKGNPFQDQIDKARVFAQEGETFFKQGDVVSAVARFALARSYDPLNEGYQRRHTELLPMANELRSTALSQQAAKEANGGNFTAGAELYMQAFEVNPGNGSLAFRAADLFFKQGTDLPAARVSVEAAIAKAPKNPTYRVLATQILEKLGELMLARQHLAAAVEAGADDEDTKKLLKRLR